VQVREDPSRIPSPAGSGRANEQASSRNEPNTALDTPEDGERSEKWGQIRGKIGNLQVPPPPPPPGPHCITKNERVYFCDTEHTTESVIQALGDAMLKVGSKAHTELEVTTQVAEAKKPKEDQKLIASQKEEIVRLREDLLGTKRELVDMTVRDTEATARATQMTCLLEELKREREKSDPDTSFSDFHKDEVLIPSYTYHSHNLRT